MMYKILAIIYILVGSYFLLVATDKAEESKDPVRRAKFLAKWGVTWKILSAIMIVGGLVQLFLC